MTVTVPEMLDVGEAARALHLSEWTIQRLCREAKLEGANKPSGGKWLIPAETVSALLGAK
jgi:excisionase family DNA binding protein